MAVMILQEDGGKFDTSDPLSLFSVDDAVDTPLETSSLTCCSVLKEISFCISDNFTSRARTSWRTARYWSLPADSFRQIAISQRGSTYKKWSSWQNGAAATRTTAQSSSSSAHTHGEQPPPATIASSIAAAAAAAAAGMHRGGIDDSPVVRVLTDRALLHHTTSFMAGFPQLVFEFQRDVAPLYPNPRTPLAADQFHRRLPRHVDEFPKRIGLWPHVAIEANDQRVLEALFELHIQQPYYARMQCMSFAEVVRCAAFFGRLEMLQWMVRVFPSKDPSWVWEPELMEMALKNVENLPGIDLLEWLDVRCPPICRAIRDLDKVIHLHTSHGNLKVIRYFHDVHRHVPSPQAVNIASVSGNLELIRYFHERYPGTFTAHATAYAASKGHVDIIQFLHENGVAKLSNTAMDAAAKNEHVGVLEYLHHHRQGGTCSKAAMDEVAFRGHADIVTFLHANRCNEGCTFEAMDKGMDWHGYFSQTDYLDYMLEDLNYREKFYEIEDTEFSCMEYEADEVAHCTDGADLDARARHFQAIKFLHENRSEGCTEKAMNHAARCGHLEVVQFLHENRTEGCTWEAMEDAAYGAHLLVIKFLYEHHKAECGEDWAVSRAIEWACRGNQLDILRYLVDECGGECPESALQYMVARCVNHLELVTYLYENLATRHLFDALPPEESWDAIHEMLKSAYLQHQDDPQHSMHQLNNAVAGNRALLVRVLCGYTTRGCFVEAKRIAIEYQNAGITAVLDEFLDLEVLSCSLTEHTFDDGPRPCQKIKT